VVGAVLREVVELLDVLVHTTQTLLQVQELLKLVSHHAHGDVVPTKSRAELSPWHLVAILNGGGEVSPPSTHGSTKLLGREQSLLDLGVVQKPKLGLDDVKPVIHLQQISCLDKHWRVHRHDVDVGSLHPWLAVGGRASRCMRFSVSTLMSSFCVASSCLRLTSGGGGGGGGRGVHDHHCEAQFLLPQHVRSTAQAHPE
jgi:hypothetical protein